MRLEKKYLYIFVLNFFLYSLRLCPLVLLPATGVPLKKYIRIGVSEALQDFESL